MATESTTLSILEAIQAATIARVGTASGAAYTIADADILIKKLPWNLDNITLPGVLLTPVPELERPGTNVSDDVGYGVQVTAAQVSNRDLVTDADKIYFWREAIAGAFRRKRLTAIDGSFPCIIEPKPVIDPQNFSALCDATAFVVRVWVRVQRT
jgi:hypothetical protein